MAILEKYVNAIIGDQAIAVLKEPYKRNVFLGTLKKALMETETKFIQNNSDHDMRDLLLQLPLSGDHDLENALLDFSTNPSSLSLEHLLVRKIKSYAPILSDDKVRAGVNNYIDILRYELLSVPEVREVLIAWASILSSQSIKGVETNSSFALDQLKIIADHTQKIADAVKPKSAEIVFTALDSRQFTIGRTEKNKFIETYIERDADKRIFREMKNSGITITIKGPSKMGKSLLVSNLLKKISKRSVNVDFSRFDSFVFNNNVGFYRKFCQSIAVQLGIKSSIMKRWDSSIAPTLWATYFFEKEALACTEGNALVLTIDNADRLLGTELKADFFPMLRYWSNQRSERKEWENLDLIIVISSEPKFLIANTIDSPFNISVVINVEEFTFDQVADLNASYKDIFSAKDLNALFKLLNGHPYLTQLAFASIHNKQADSLSLLNQPLGIDSPFLPFLDVLLTDLGSDAELFDSMRTIARDHVFPSNTDHIRRLQSLGIIRLGTNQILLRNELYRKYFQEQL